MPERIGAHRKGGYNPNQVPVADIMERLIIEREYYGFTYRFILGVADTFSRSEASGKLGQRDGLV